MIRYIILLSVCLCVVNASWAKDFELLSPDGTIKVEVSSEAGLSVKVSKKGVNMFTLSDVALHIEGYPTEQYFSKIKRTKQSEHDKIIFPEIKEKYKEIREQYNTLELEFKGNCFFSVRAYNQGVAYRFSTGIKDSITVLSEQFSLHFDQKDSVILQKSGSFNSSYETPYEHSAVKDVTDKGYCCLPALFEKADGAKIVVCESALEDYPGTWLKANGSSTLKAIQPGYPLSFRTDGSPYGQGQVKKHGDFIAKTEGKRNFPWRVFAIADTDADLLKNTMVYQLANPNKIEDVSWIKPGVVAFDWWGRRNIYGTDFKSGINTETAKYFIDFCADFGFEYFLFDDGWSEQDDLLKINPALDMEAVMDYARKKDVKIMVWAIWNTFEKQKDQVWEMLEKWGISGIKFDFMNRDDQKMVQFYHEVAEEAAKRKMVIDFHGAYKPAGLRRAYPNVLTREGLIEFEYNGWTKHDTPEHHNLLPYIRMVTGPMDYIPYTTHNSTEKNFRPVGDMPMGMGTRAHSMALFVILESPMQMLPDSPSDYYRERECTEFISQIPTEWDDLKVIKAKIGEHTLLARKNGDDWYIGAITNWDQKSFSIAFDFLDDGKYKMEYIKDGINTDTRAIDYVLDTQIVDADSRITINLAPGGGWIARLVKEK